MMTTYDRIDQMNKQMVELGRAQGELDAYNKVLDILTKHHMYRNPAYQEVGHLVKVALARITLVSKEKVT